MPLKRLLPVHLTYFTTVVEEEGKVQNFADVYGLDSKIGAALFGKGVKLKAPTVEADAQEIHGSQAGEQPNTPGASPN